MTKLDTAYGPSPKVLLTDTNRWALAARLAVSLSEAGCDVSAVCPSPNHALLRTRAVRRTFRYSGLRPLESISAAIATAQPDLVIPTCDRSVEHLHELYAKLQARGGEPHPTAALIERSLGPASAYAIVSSRYDLLQIARSEGIRVPATTRIADPIDDREFAGVTFPAVVKVDGSWGGLGVRVVRSREEARECFTQFGRMYNFSRAVKRLIVNRDHFWLRPWWKRVRRPVMIQSFIPGCPANCTVISWKGKVLAAIAVRVVRSEGATGPASVVQIVENPDMLDAATRLASRLDLSGFFGLDFILDHYTGAAWLIEMNPRCAPPCHLRLGAGRDLAGALWSQLANAPLPATSPVTCLDTIAYFPQGSASAGAETSDCYRDIPHGEPDLIQELLNPYPDRSLLFRLVHHLTFGRGTGAPNDLYHPPIDQGSQLATVHCTTVPCGIDSSRELADGERSLAKFSAEPS